MLSGYRVMSRRFVKSFPALSTGFEIETELTVHALELDLPISEILEAVRRDKKVINGRLHFVLATGIGTTATVDDVTEEEITSALDRLHSSIAAGTR